MYEANNIIVIVANIIPISHCLHLKLYPTVALKQSYGAVEEMKDFIAYADGRNDLIDIRDRISVPVDELIEIFVQLGCCTDYGWINFIFPSGG